MDIQMNEQAAMAVPEETSYKEPAAVEDPDNGMLEEMSAGISFQTDFWREKYLREYIREGGSKIKFITGRQGSGKSHLLRLAPG